MADGAVLIDVRSAGTRQRTGVIPGAVVVDREELAAEFGLDSPARHREIAGHETPIVVVCGSVNGSGPVAEALIGRWRSSAAGSS